MKSFLDQYHETSRISTKRIHLLIATYQQVGRGHQLTRNGGACFSNRQIDTALLI